MVDVIEVSNALQTNLDAMWYKCDRELYTLFEAKYKIYRIYLRLDKLIFQWCVRLKAILIIFVLLLGLILAYCSLVFHDGNVEKEKTYI